VVFFHIFILHLETFAQFCGDKIVAKLNNHSYWFTWSRVSGSGRMCRVFTVAACFHLLPVQGQAGALLPADFMLLYSPRVSFWGWSCCCHVLLSLFPVRGRAKSSFSLISSHVFPVGSFALVILSLSSISPVSDQRRCRVLFFSSTCFRPGPVLFDCRIYRLVTTETVVPARILKLSIRWKKWKREGLRISCYSQAQAESARYHFILSLASCAGFRASTQFWGL